jgi:hypothetical protein
VQCQHLEWLLKTKKNIRISIQLNMMESNIINVASSGCTLSPGHQPRLQIQGIWDHQVLGPSTRKDTVSF